MIERPLGGRASANWLVRRDGRPAVLRRHHRPPWQSADQELASIEWRASARIAVADAGWPAARPWGPPRRFDGHWWELEDRLVGEPRDDLPPAEHGRLVADFHALSVGRALPGPQPGALDHLAVLTDDDVGAVVADCADPDARSLLADHLERARALAGTIDWSASPRVLVHGDLMSHNLLWRDGRLTGLLDFELSTVDRRVRDLMLVWRCRYDDRVSGYDATAPLNADERRMLRVDWWALTVSLAVVQLRAGRQPDRWELDGLRRSSPLAERLATG